MMVRTKRGQKGRKPTREEVKIETWQERDRLHVGIKNKETGVSVIDWWDDDVRQLFEGGFFEGGMPREHWYGSEKPSPKFENSVLKYAEDIGVLEKSKSESKLKKWQRYQR